MRSRLAAIESPVTSAMTCESLILNLSIDRAWGNLSAAIFTVAYSSIAARIQPLAKGGRVYVAYQKGELRGLRRKWMQFHGRSEHSARA